MLYIGEGLPHDDVNQSEKVFVSINNFLEKNLVLNQFSPQIKQPAMSPQVKGNLSRLGLVSLVANIRPLDASKSTDPKHVCAISRVTCSRLMRMSPAMT